MPRNFEKYIFGLLCCFALTIQFLSLLYVNSESIVVVASLDTPTAAVTTLTTSTTKKKKKKKTKNIMNTYNNDNNNDDEDDKDTTHDERKNTITKQKKRFGVLHMGPHKTGTSTIQQLLHDDTIFNLLGDDGWDASMVRGKIKVREGIKKYIFKHKIIRECIKTGKLCGTKEWHEALNMTVKIGADRQKHFLMSDETMANYDFVSNDYWKQFVSLFQQHYRLHAILVYRRYFEWLPSWYNQQYKYEGPYGDRVLIWPSDGGVAIPTFGEYWDLVLNNTVNDPWAKNNKWDATTGKPVHDVWTIKNRLEAQLIKVTILNYHSGDLVENFFCNALPISANQTCQKVISDKELYSVRKNKSNQYYDADRIAVAAKEQGLLAEGLSRNTVKFAVQRFWHQQTALMAREDLPWKCLETDKERLLRQISYQAEEQILPSLLDSFDASFDAALTQRKFCNIDTTILLQNETWRSFLSSLPVPNE